MKSSNLCNFIRNTGIYDQPRSQDNFLFLYRGMKDVLEVSINTVGRMCKNIVPILLIQKLSGLVIKVSFQNLFKNGLNDMRYFKLNIHFIKFSTKRIIFRGTHAQY